MMKMSDNEKRALVALAKCESYEADVAGAVRRLVEGVSGGTGMSAFVKDGMKVAIKPNLVGPLKPEKGGTTHPEVARAVVRLVREAGGEPFFVESPGGPTARAYLKKVYVTTGLAQVAEEEGVEIVYDLDTKEVEVPGGSSMKRAELVKALVEADFVINICKPKGHGFMRYTGAVKNLFGAVAGLSKADHHVRRSNHRQFAAGIIDLFNAVAPGLSICDGVIGMHRKGPTSGDPYRLGVLACSENAFCLDRVMLEIIGAETGTVPINALAEEMGLAPKDINEIRIIDVNEIALESECASATSGEASCETPAPAPGSTPGSTPAETLSRFAVNDFVLPKVQTNEEVGVMGGVFNKLAVKYFRQKPVFNAKKCIKCGMCVKSCPAGCLTLKKGMDKPQPDLKKCIRCFCCEELCMSQAVDIRRGRS